MLSTVLQGFYQSHQATAASVAVNNLHLLRGLIGRPGAGVLQMNGQPTAQNTRECGADGDLPGFRNWDNPDHVAELARLWNVDELTIPHWAPPTHAMQIFRYAEQGSIGWLWISATNPAVSMPESARIRRILQSDSCFVVVSGPLPDRDRRAGRRGIAQRRLGREDRDLHQCHSDGASVRAGGGAAGPGQVRLRHLPDVRRGHGFPGQGRRCADLLAYAGGGVRGVARMQPRPALRLHRAFLREAPRRHRDSLAVYRAAPDGTDRLYADAVFPTDPDECEDYGHDLLTGGAVTPTEYRALALDGRAHLKGAAYTPAHEEPGPDFPLLYTTGRTVYHFHTRTKTGRSRPLRDAAPDAWVELNPADAQTYGIEDGDLVRVESPRGAIEVRLGWAWSARAASSRRSTTAAGTSMGPLRCASRQANELTMTIWDPVSKQPLFKTAACRVSKVRKGDGQ